MIICSAIRLGHMVICGLHHSDCYETLHELNPELSLAASRQGVEEGFITHNNEFLNRTQAYTHARLCGQLSETIQEQKRIERFLQLYSEDLY